MKNNIHSKIKRFLESEDGRVSAKAPLALGCSDGGCSVSTNDGPITRSGRI